MNAIVSCGRLARTRYMRMAKLSALNEFLRAAARAA